MQHFTYVVFWFTVATPSKTQNDQLYSKANTKHDVSLTKEGSTSRRALSYLWLCHILVRLTSSSISQGPKLTASTIAMKCWPKGLLPVIHRLSGNNFTLQQDAAPSHRSKHIVAYLKANVPNFMQPSNWPPNHPDLNLVDYSIWGVLQQLVYCRKIHDLEHLKELLQDCWTMISQDLVDTAIDQFSKRLTLVICAQSGHIKHCLN